MITSKKYSILLIEDDLQMNTALTTTLSRSYDVISLYNGKEALSILLDKKPVIPDIIISDIMMPAVDGFDFVKRIKKIHNLKDIPVIFITGIGPKKMSQAFDIGVIDFIEKPFNYEILLKKIQFYLDNKQLISNLKTELLHKDILLENKKKSTESKIAEIQKFINQYYDLEDLNRDYLANIFSMNSDYLGKIFRKVTGKRIDQFIDEVRIEKAKYLIRNTKYRIESIALMVGYDSLRTFNRLFMKMINKTPKEYREQKKTKELRMTKKQ